MVITLEMPFVQVVIALKQGGRVLQIGIIFNLMYSALLFGLVDLFDIYVIPIAMFVAQAINFASYAALVSRHFAQNRWNGQPVIS
jgi:hypothetical protein